MTQNTDTQPLDLQTLSLLGIHARSIQKFCNAQGRFWHRIFVLGDRPSSRPGDNLKGWAYDGAWQINHHLPGRAGVERASTMLDLLDALDAYNQAASGYLTIKSYPVKLANRAAIVAHVTPRS